MNVVSLLSSTPGKTNINDLQESVTVPPHAHPTRAKSNLSIELKHEMENMKRIKEPKGTGWKTR